MYPSLFWAGTRLRGEQQLVVYEGEWPSSPNPSFRETMEQHSTQSQPAFPHQAILALDEMMCMNTQSQSIQIHHLGLSSGL